MLTIFVLAPILLVVVIVSTIVRLLTLPFRHHHRFGYGGYHRHRHGFGGLGTVLFLLALDRIFGRRF
jgi:hypothetical protein